MQKSIACLLLVVLLGMIPPLLLAQQNQNPQKSDSEIEALEKRVSELEKQLQTMENVEKMELQAKLADANAKLADANAKLITANFDTLKEKVWVDHEERMRRWSHWFFGILGITVVISGAAIWFSLKSLIADRVEKNLDGFKAAMDAQDVIKNELRVLKKERAASVLEDFMYLPLDEEQDHPERIKILPEEDLLQVFDDEKYDIELRYKAAEVLAARKSSRLVSPSLKFLNSVVDSDSEINFKTKGILRGLVNLLGRIYTPETYQGLKGFLNRLLTENPRHKDLFLTWTVFSLGWVSVALDVRDSVALLRKAIPHLKDLQQEQRALSDLAGHFDTLNESEGIKEILNHVINERSDMEEVKDKCLALLQKHDPEFVKEWQARETTDNSNA